MRAQTWHSLALLLGLTTALDFDTLLVFGDQLSDNGNGSTAHGLNPGNIYGHHTWTDGPVAVQYLSDLLDVPLSDYSWGGSYGGGLAGPTVDNSYTPAKNLYQGKPVPSTKEQITSFLKGKPPSDGEPVPDVKRSLALVWVGQNDVKKHTNWGVRPPTQITVNNAHNVDFYNTWSGLLVTQAEQLAKAGAVAVVVPNIYPLHLAPASLLYWCKGNNVCTKNWGKVIQAANAKLESSLAASKYKAQLVYYDVFGRMVNIMNNKDSFGFTEPLNYCCDAGNGNTLPWTKFKQCQSDTNKGQGNWTNARPFFWFTAGNMETNVHRFIAEDMKEVIDGHAAGAAA
ncbi:hypothetical protein BDY17DRAFT_299422 [Neohortaea acidophila]|uniref:Carbohydrate esterase family 16 protein n=1 Tax=Neohortaea acidophila TaxID=245834 RepID=A0A6A6PNK9_9PEZI|nr:uncharacterized protein BDY17DRAFT_299422 [Neohortaea acidophila]KAF2481659.1 hypothetical protein BDY17DRAFT_299422 [Neohortaea acidophila]